MAQCFCGCGRKVAFRSRPVNKRGSIINGDLAVVRTMLRQGLQSPNAELFLHDGELFCAGLAEAVHAGVDPGPELERETRGFMALGRQHFSQIALGKRVRQVGYTGNEGAQAIARGEWDPFAEVDIPRA